MTDLTPVRLSQDGTKLILVSERGVEFDVLIDERLRSVLRGDQTRLVQVEKKMESSLRPRDIQNRIRSGESADELAAASGTDVSRIMVYAAPVLAERAHVAQTAQKSSLRRGRADATMAGRTLGEAVGVRLEQLGVPVENVEWDAWRRADGRWTVVADFATSGSPRRAIFTHDVPGRFAIADNDEARILTGELSDATESDVPAPPSARRLSAVPSGQDELPLGDDAIELVRGRDAAALSPSVVFDEPEPRHEPSRPEPQTPVDTTEDTVEVPEEDHASRKKGRSAMPSWDEIMFGGKPE